MKRLLLLSIPLLFNSQKPLKIAFISDIHFQDLYGFPAGTSFCGAANPITGKCAFVRSMSSQLRSTRIFNENYFALFQALDDINSQGIKLVVLPGDCTDNGQPFNLRGLRKILNRYCQRYGMRFLMTTGNHDPVRPFGRGASTADFIDGNGETYTISSKEIADARNKVVHFRDFSEGGYEEVFGEMKDFGFTPDRRDLFWQTPFSKGSYRNYNYTSAIEDSKLQNRTYQVAPGFVIPDLSYVAEPVRGIWILAIDGNTYIPESQSADPRNPNSYNGAEIGYNNILSSKTHLFSWIKKVADEAKRRKKVLIAFTHYPILDYNDGASEEITKLLGPGKWQMKRLPSEEVAQEMFRAGIRLHFAGHMHINDTGVKNFPAGMLVNVQVPSLAAYRSGYKVLTVNSPDSFIVQTKTVDKVPGFNELFPFYEKEYLSLKNHGAKNLWNHDILRTKSYRNFMEFYLSELVRLRMIPEEWPADFIAKTQDLTARQLLNLSTNGHGTAGPDFTGWNFSDTITDLYKLWFADSLARRDIPAGRLRAYKVLEENFKTLQPRDNLSTQLRLFFNILEKFSNGAPAENFKIDFQKSTVTPLP